VWEVGEVHHVWERLREWPGWPGATPVAEVQDYRLGCMGCDDCAAGMLELGHGETLRLRSAPWLVLAPKQTTRQWKVTG
jgi:hypothetical protein